MGYDISDYKAIDPIYGTLEDVDHIIAELKKRNMKLMMDVVFNHTSDQHAWFLESRSSLENPKRDWYIWKKPKRDAKGTPQPPNNWCQILGDAKSAWTYDEETDEYYLSLFSSEQPDLNWENPDVRSAVHDVMLFWLERGVSGFRIDVINLISKVQTFPDAAVVVPDQEYQLGAKYFANGPRLHEYLREINQKVLSKYDTITVGEMPWVSDVNEIIKTVGSDAGELNMIFIFDLVDIDTIPGHPRFTENKFSLRDIKKIVNRWQRTMIEHDGWNSVFIENHDNPRSVSRYADDSDEFRERGAKLLALMQTTLSGTLFVYQGEELGMRNAPPSWGPEEYKDIESQNLWKKYTDRYPNDPSKLKEARRLLQTKSRDHARLPMQWSSAPNAGFCSPDARPWIRPNDDFSHVNVAAQMSTPDRSDTPLSVWQYWQRGLSARKTNKDVFVYGDFKQLDEAHENVFAYLRIGQTKEVGTWIIVLNFSGTDVSWEIPTEVKVGSWIAGTYDGHNSGKPEKATEGTMILQPWEGVLGKCS
ncbi:MAG: hypothetical protein M4579_003934 [Chaenotheca gracillima]|nr:MAG: hypothetical protein M4579_003934 [Chaenotheca gracillima]